MSPPPPRSSPPRRAPVAVRRPPRIRLSAASTPAILGLQDRLGRGERPGVRDRPLHHARSEVVERRRHDPGADRTHRGGPAREISHPEPAQPGALERRRRLRQEIRDRVIWLEHTPQPTHRHRVTSRQHLSDSATFLPRITLPTAVKPAQLARDPAEHLTDLFRLEDLDRRPEPRYLACKRPQAHAPRARPPPSRRSRRRRRSADQHPLAEHVAEQRQVLFLYASARALIGRRRSSISAAIDRQASARSNPSGLSTGSLATSTDPIRSTRNVRCPFSVSATRYQADP